VQFSWKSHARQYIEVIDDILALDRPVALTFSRRSRLPRMDRALISDLDRTLTGHDASLKTLLDRIGDAGDRVAFGIVTGRSMSACRKILDRLALGRLDFLITDSGGGIHYGWPKPEVDKIWSRHIDHHWNPGEIRQALADRPGIVLRPQTESGRFRIACRIEPGTAPPQAIIRQHLRQRNLRATLLFDSETLMDILPIRAAPGLALRFLSFKLDLPMERILVAGDSGNDAGMLRGDTLGVVVGNYKPEIEYLRTAPRVYFATRRHAQGILEGIDHYDFFGKVRIPREESAA
jgi:sucrose-phosphate synthase